jgi:hypothetical protein
MPFLAPLTNKKAGDGIAGPGTPGIPFPTLCEAQGMPFPALWMEFTFFVMYIFRHENDWISLG